MSGKRTRYLPDMALHRDELEQLAQERFVFLVREKDFGPRPRKRDAQWTSYFYTHRRASIGIQIHLDFRDDTVWAYLVRLRDGELPPHGFVDVNRGERIRVSILSLLRDILHVEDGRLDALSDMLYTPPQPEQLRDHRWAEDVLARWSDLVERYIDLVVRQPMEALFPPPPPGASPASQA
jgi:hypothetical protein